jgi:hypothetical protein
VAETGRIYTKRGIDDCLKSGRARSRLPNRYQDEGEKGRGKPTTFECILELLAPLVLAPLGSIGPLATAGAILFSVEEERESSVEGMTTEAARAERVKN